jgi:hypothetical protein
VEVPHKGYLAIEFDTADFVDDGKISALENAATPGIRLGSFSESPGDFDVADECRYSWGLGGGLSWSTNGLADACQLNFATTYYFNITFTDGVDPDSATCTFSTCWINLQYSNPDY